MIHRGRCSYGNLCVQRDLAQRFFDCEEVECVPSDPHYSKARHRRWRDKVIARAGGLCEQCRRYGRKDKDGLPVTATVAHHIQTREEHPELQYLLSNGRALCEACHNEAHPEKGGAHDRWRRYPPTRRG